MGSSHPHVKLPEMLIRQTEGKGEVGAIEWKMKTHRVREASGKTLKLSWSCWGRWNFFSFSLHFLFALHSRPAEISCVFRRGGFQITSCLWRIETLKYKTESYSTPEDNIRAWECLKFVKAFDDFFPFFSLHPDLIRWKHSLRLRLRIIPFSSIKNLTLEEKGGEDGKNVH